MKLRHIFPLIALCIASYVHAETIIVCSLDTALSQKREAAFNTWHSPDEGYAIWKELSPKNIPIYYEKKDGDLGRDIYIPRMGLGYWVLSGLSSKALLQTTKEQEEHDFVLIAASCYTGSSGEKSYWALWVARQDADKVAGKMKELGISPARIEYSYWEIFVKYCADLMPYTGVLMLLACILSLLSVILNFAIWVKITFCRKAL